MFKVPTSDGEKPENRFEFSIAEKSYSVPKLGFAPVEASLLFEQGYRIEGLIACAGSAEASAALRLLATDQLTALEQAWIAASRVSPGESDGSAHS